MFFYRPLQLGKKRKLMVKILDIGRIFVKSGEREVAAQIGRVGIFDNVTSYWPRPNGEIKRFFQTLKSSNHHYTVITS